MWRLIINQMYHQCDTDYFKDALLAWRRLLYKDIRRAELGVKRVNRDR